MRRVKRKPKRQQQTSLVEVSVGHQLHGPIEPKASTSEVEVYLHSATALDQQVSVRSLVALRLSPRGSASGSRSAEISTTSRNHGFVCAQVVADCSRFDARADGNDQGRHGTCYFQRRCLNAFKTLLRGS